MQLKKGVQRGFVIVGELTNDRSGYSVSNAGDVNGDGLDDLIIGANNAQVGKGWSAGKSYVVFGKGKQDYTNVINLSDIAYGIGGFVINSASAGDHSGWSVSSAGDVNGDGLDDLIIGSASPSRIKIAELYVVFGKQGTDPIKLSAIAASKSGFVIKVDSAHDFSGNSVSSAGDVNGDGLDDLIVGAKYARNQGFESGRSYVVFGKKDNTAIDLSDIADGIGGFVINGESANDISGTSVSNAGDVNGDGLDDLIVGAQYASPTNKIHAGKSYVVFGKKDTDHIELSAISDGIGGFVINGESAYDDSGCSVSNAGDVNGDGLDDLIVGAYFAKTGDLHSIKKYGVGKSYVVFGKKDNTDIELSDIAAGIGGFVINGESAYDKSGHSVSSAGDVNGDGLDDLIVGAYQAAPRDKSHTSKSHEAWGPDPSGKTKAGKSYVVFGKNNNTNVIELSDIAAGIGGFVINGELAGDYSGYSVSSAGDVNGDGLDDLIVGAYGASSSAGKSYVIFGKTDTGSIDLSKLSYESKYAIDYLGNKHTNTLTGTTKDEIFVAGAGNDTLIGNGGMDVFNAGVGNDDIVINASNITALEQVGVGNRARVDGGGGIDTLK
ncbi:Flagellar hook-length control protein FliK, partial [uncultured Gammaproteobacteria bacterium]